MIVLFLMCKFEESSCKAIPPLPLLLGSVLNSRVPGYPKGKWDKNEIKEGENTADERAFMKRRAQ